jgi:hypothetical protein
MIQARQAEIKLGRLGLSENGIDTVQIDKAGWGKYDVNLMDDALSTARVLVEIQEEERRAIAR